MRSRYDAQRTVGVVLRLHHVQEGLILVHQVTQEQAAEARRPADVDRFAQLCRRDPIQGRAIASTLAGEDLEQGEVIPSGL